MKKVIFVCLLSLSVCLSQQNAPAAAAAAAADPTKPPITQATANLTDAKGNETKTDHPQAAAAVTPSTVVVETPAGQNATANVTQASNETTPKINDTKTTEKTTSTNTTSSTIAPAKLDPAKGNNNETKPGPAVPANDTNADSKKNETTTTPKGENVSPTAAPVEAKSRAFDGPSFIGGIILTLGLLAIGFMGFKYYKNQTERNYHTL